MPLDAEVSAYLKKAAASGAPSRSAMTVEQTRDSYRQMRTLAGDPPELTAVCDRSVPGNAGAIPIRVYRPSSRDDLPLLVYFHGGRFFSGDLETHDNLCRILSALCGWIVAAVDYRRAPEHPFPAAVDDAYSATSWLASHASEIRADPARVAVGGDSAGGNLAAAVALLARDAGGPRLLGQMLVYPMLDATCSMPSHQTCGSGYGPESNDMKRGYREYMPEGTDPTDQRLSPLRATDFRNLPAAYVLTAEYDSLRDEGESYAKALEAAGVAVQAVRFDGAIHGFFQLGGVLKLGREANQDAAAFLRSLAEDGDLIP